MASCPFANVFLACFHKDCAVYFSIYQTLEAYEEGAMEKKDTSNNAQSELYFPTQIVCIYAQPDESFYRDLQIYLVLWQRAQYIAWLEIRAGDDPQQAIQTHLQQADLILLLISPSFFISNSCYRAMKIALREQATRQVPVVSVLIRVSDWKESDCGALKALPENELPIAEWEHRERAYENIRAGLVHFVPGLPVFRATLPDTRMREKMRLFFCYAHEDESFLKNLKVYLSPLQRQGLIETWYDRDISAGAVWEREIDIHLNEADVILLLISPDFINSDYCYGIEMKRAVERHDSGEAHTIPIILRPTDWMNTPFKKLQALPKNGKPITSGRRKHDRDQYFLEVIEGIREAIETVKNGHSVNNAASLSPEKYQSNIFGIDPNNSGYALFKEKRYEEALALYRSHLMKYPQDESLLRSVCYTLFLLKRYEEAKEVCNELLKLHPDNIEIYLEVCDFLARQAQEIYGRGLIGWILGRSGAGKSSTINRLAGMSVVATKGGKSVAPSAVPYEISEIVLHGLQCTIIDTPDVFDV
jgi:tetratricopeptide (TPR) repeat protein